MRLLHVKKLGLHTFYGSDIPPYAILSHTWLRDDEEVTFEEMQSLHIIVESLWLEHNPNDPLIAKPGIRKIKYLCKQAAHDGYEWAWLDTCCIQKSNSSELSEAINSMFGWYSKAGICYAYLFDIDHVSGNDFLTSRWWTRAWTLQELLAPKEVKFYDGQWRYIGTKQEQAAEISSITGINKNTLQNPQTMFNASVAQRMSWAAEREATGLEDRAYSLLGVFEVSMPMLYGEGNQAFMRLQESILKGNNDQTIFAWAHHTKSEQHSKTMRSDDRWLPDMDYPEEDMSDYMDDDTIFDLCRTGIFAGSPESFKHCGSVTFHRRFALETHIAKFNGAWRMEMPLIHVKTERDTCRIGLLPCGYIEQPYHLLAIFLRSWTTGNRFERASIVHGAFTFLIDSGALYAARVEQLWVDRTGWVDRHLESAGNQYYFCRSVQVRIKVHPERYTFAAARPSTALWIDKGSVLQLSEEMEDSTLDNVVITFKYFTGSYISFALHLSKSTDTQSFLTEDVPQDRIVVYAGLLDQYELHSRKASIHTRCVFNQFVSVLEINEADNLSNKALFGGVRDGMEKNDKFLRHIRNERAFLLEAVKGPEVVRECGHEFSFDDIDWGFTKTGFWWKYDGNPLEEDEVQRRRMKDERLTAKLLEKQGLGNSVA